MKRFKFFRNSLFDHDSVANNCLLIQLLRQPDSIRKFTASDWDLVLRQARKANVLCAVATVLEDEGLLDLIPAYALAHFRWADVLAKRHAQAVRYEVDRISHALSQVGVDVILLKGAAYVEANLPPAKGRLFSDVDIMVDKARLNDVEAALMLHGWVSGGHSDYDQRYYRNWMHELPPMQHAHRRTTIDVHHAILPQTTAVRPDSAELIKNAIVLDPLKRHRVLAPVDMVLHSATHLFYDGEFDNALRDLIDLHRLITHFSDDAQFWEKLCIRAVEMKLTRPLFYAIRYLQRILHTHVPEMVRDLVVELGGPPKWQVHVMDQVFGRALLPKHASCSDRFSSAARSFVYVRANWLRMPPILLAAHLSYKAFVDPFIQRKLRRAQARLCSVAQTRH